MKYLICNLKSNKTFDEIVTYEHNLRTIPKSNINLIICPSTPYLICFSKDNYILSSQDISRYTGSNFTGETTASQLASLGCSYTLIGHCERRAYFKEDATIITNKIKNALSKGIKPIYIIGETKEEHSRGKTMHIIESQIGRVLNNFKREEIKNMIIVYEPVWAVNNSDVVNIKDISDTISFIKVLIKDYYELEIPILYGGGVNEKNIRDLNSISKLDGVLVGEASLDIEKLKSIYFAIN